MINAYSGPAKQIICEVSLELLVKGDFVRTHTHTELETCTQTDYCNSRSRMHM